MAVLCLADEDLSAAEREEVGRELWRLGSDPENWQPGQMKIEFVEVPSIIGDESITLVRALMIIVTVPLDYCNRICCRSVPAW